MAKIDVTKATPRPWKRAGRYGLKAPYTYPKYAGGGTYDKITVANRRNQEYREPVEDAANIELVARAVALYDFLPIIKSFLELVERAEGDMGTEDMLSTMDKRVKLELLIEKIEPSNTTPFKSK